MFGKVTIIGMGLIGSSIARNVLAHKLAKTLVVADASEEVCKKLVELELGNIVTDELALSVEDADLVILAVPVGAMGKVAKIIAPNLKQGAILSDTGSHSHGSRSPC